MGSLNGNQKVATVEMKNTTYQNLCDKAKAVLRGKFIALLLLFEKEKKGLNYLNLHLNKAEK